MTGPVLVTVMEGRPSRQPVTTSTRPAGSLLHWAVDQVGDKAFGETGVTCRRRGVVVAGAAAVVRAGGNVPAEEDLVSEGSEVERLPAVEPCFASGQGEERLDEPLLLPAGREGTFAGSPPGSGGGTGVGEHLFEEGLLQGEGSAQLVGGVGDELALGGEGPFQAVEQVVESVPQFLELIVWPGGGEPAV